MRKETPQEQAIKNALPVGIRNIVDVSMKYQDYFRMVNKHLSAIYDKRADWKECLSGYDISDEYKNNCHIAKKCDDIPELKKEDILRMIAEEEAYNTKVKNLLKMYDRIIQYKDKNQAYPEEKLAAELLGILPESGKDALYQWLVQKNDITPEEQIDIEKKISENQGHIGVLVNLLTKLFVPGIQMTFPSVGTVMTQQKGKYYFRGENAYYGSSRPSMYRGGDNKIPDYIKETIDLIRFNEGCYFLDHFDAVKKWGDSAVNYMALAQHYGLRTMMMDVTSHLKTALFFACCEFGQDGKWHYLTKQKIANKDSRKGIAKLGGDSRYGILYRTPTEITDMKWAISDDDAGINIITPIGYQPFMRCSSQNGYMLIVKEKGYDMMHDAKFDKFKFRLDEEFCKWIYEEMVQGNKIYPNNDIPDISGYFAKINNSHIFSKQAFQAATQGWNISDKEAEIIKAELAKYGFHISENNVEFITNNQLQKINKRYSIEAAIERTGIEPKCSPILCM